MIIFNQTIKKELFVKELPDLKKKDYNSSHPFFDFSVFANEMK